MRGTRSQGRPILGYGDLCDLMWSLVPARHRAKMTPAAFAQTGKHRCKTILLRLWQPDGTLPRVRLDDICTAITKQGVWAPWAVGVGDCIEAQRGRLLRYISRLNQAIAASSWAPYVHIHRVGTRLELLTDREAVRHARTRSVPTTQHHVEVEVLATRHAAGTPIVRVGDELHAQCVSTLGGYLSVFHVSVTGLVQKIFPLQHERKYITARRDRIVIPDGLPTRHKPWRVEKTGTISDGLESLVAVVTKRDADVTADQVAATLAPLKRRGIDVHTLTLDDLPKKEYAFGEAKYRYVSR